MSVVFEFHGSLVGNEQVAQRVIVWKFANIVPALIEMYVK